MPVCRADNNLLGGRDCSASDAWCTPATRAADHRRTPAPRGSRALPPATGADALPRRPSVGDLPGAILCTMIGAGAPRRSRPSLRASWSTAELAVYADHRAPSAIRAARSSRSIWRRATTARGASGAATPSRRGSASSSGARRHASGSSTASSTSYATATTRPISSTALLGAVVPVASRPSTIATGAAKIASPTAVLDALERLAPGPGQAHPARDRLQRRRAVPSLRCAIELIGHPEPRRAVRDRRAPVRLVPAPIAAPALRDARVPRSGGRGVLETGAEIIEIFHYGYPRAGSRARTTSTRCSRSSRRSRATPDCNELYATYGDLAQEPDSLPRGARAPRRGRPRRARRPRSRRLTPIGRSLVVARRARSRPAARPAQRIRATASGCCGPRHRRRRQHPRQRRRLARPSSSASCRTHVALLVDPSIAPPRARRARRHPRVPRLPLRRGSPPRVGPVPLTGDVRAPTAALRAPLAFNRLTDCGIESFDHVGDDSDWSSLAQLVELLESLAGAPRPCPPVFRVAWGF